MQQPYGGYDDGYQDGYGTADPGQLGAYQQPADTTDMKALGGVAATAFGIAVGILVLIAVFKRLLLIARPQDASRRPH